MIENHFAKFLNEKFSDLDTLTYFNRPMNQENTYKKTPPPRKHINFRKNKISLFCLV